MSSLPAPNLPALNEYLVLKQTSGPWRQTIIEWMTLPRYFQFARLHLDIGPDAAFTRWGEHVQLGGPYVRLNHAGEVICAVRYGARVTEMHVGDVVRV